MVEKAAIAGIEVPGNSRISIKIEVDTAVNISAYVARQKANSFLILQLGDQLCAGEPELSIGHTVAWRVPVQYAPSRRGLLGIVGHLLINSQTGEISVADGQTTEEIMQRAELLYERTAL